MRRIVLLACLYAAVLSALAQGADNSGVYYRNADGKSGKELKTAMFNIIKELEQLTYGELWTAFKTTDVRDDGMIWDMYSNATNYEPGGSKQGANYKQEGDSYNREHSFPNSWFGGKQYPMYTDLNHIYPTDGWVNNKRGNYPFGETNGESYRSQNGFSKLGKCTAEGYDGIVFEPADEYKGDFARAYFYMATCYEDKIGAWKSNKNTEMLSGDGHTAFAQWAIDLLLRWSKNDPVSDKEVERNRAVYELQKNRNPFIDYPGLEEYLWGTMQGEPFSYDNYTPTSIRTIEFEVRPIDVYTIDGRLVLRSTSPQDARQRLPKGIYIIGGKKCVVP